MKKTIDFELLDRYLSGECTPAEAQQVERLAQEDAGVRELLGAAPAALRGEALWATDAAWTRLSAAMTIDAAPQRVAGINWTRAIVAAAAVLVVGLGLALGVRSFQSQSASQSIAAVEYRSSPRTRRTITLSDGSSITLAAASVLTVPSTFPDSGRDVYLEGQAFFDVAHDESKPFTVFADGVQTRVLGTSFDVAAYGDASPLEVTVVTGRVLVQPESAEAGTVVTPGQLARVSAGGQVVVESGVDLETYTGWTSGRLVFENVSFAQAVPRLERWYGIDIVIAEDALARARLSAFFDERQSVEEVLDVLAETLDAARERSGTTVTFRRRIGSP